MSHGTVVSSRTAHAAPPRHDGSPPNAHELQPIDAQTLFPALEAEHQEVRAFVTSRLRLASLAREPAWVRDAMARSWPEVLAEADAAA